MSCAKQEQACRLALTCESSLTLACERDERGDDERCVRSNLFELKFCLPVKPSLVFANLDVSTGEAGAHRKREGQPHEERLKGAKDGVYNYESQGGYAGGKSG